MSCAKEPARVRSAESSPANSNVSWCVNTSVIDNAWHFVLNVCLVMFSWNDMVYAVFLIFYCRFEPREVSRWIRSAIFMQINAFGFPKHNSGFQINKISRNLVYLGSPDDASCLKV